MCTPCSIISTGVYEEWGEPSLRHLLTFLQLCHILSYICSTNAGHALDVHVVAQSDNDLLDLLCKLTSRSEDEGLGLLERDIDALEN
jgi:hypothetical protein